MTIEELRAKNVELEEKILTLETENDSYKISVEKLNNVVLENNINIEKLKENNLSLFLKVSNQTIEHKTIDNIQREEVVSINSVLNKLI
ncbi:MAG: hypothetical protein RR623_06440 [Bacilli bacterium]